jgi:hypothetical protein
MTIFAHEIDEIYLKKIEENFLTLTTAEVRLVSHKLVVVRRRSPVLQVKLEKAHRCFPSSVVVVEVSDKRFWTAARS